MTLVSLETYLKNFFEEEKKSLLSNYPGLTLHRLKQDIRLQAFLNGADFDEIFDFPYLPHRRHPITIFFEKLREGVPLEYITGYSYFYKSHFKVTNDVLIPRSETEILVEMVTNDIKRDFKNKTCHLLDVGTGSGVIALSILMECMGNIEIVASDISEKALSVARENYFNLRFAISKNHQLQFIKSDRLQNIDGPFDIIVSNPPYIKRRKDFDLVHHQVASYEPAMALFLEDDIYNLWFEDFFKSIFEKLNKNGFALIEGHENHLQLLKEIALKIGFNKATVIQDYTNRDRFIRLNK